MKTWKQLMGLFFLMFIFGQPTIAGTGEEREGDDKAIHQIARVLLYLNHKPDAAGKALLQEIIKDDAVSKHVHTLAAAMMNFNHYVSFEDKGKIKAIMEDEMVPRDARSLAEIILNALHKPSLDDMKELRRMVK